MKINKWNTPLKSANGKTADNILFEFGRSLGGKSISEILAQHGFVISTRGINIRKRKLGIKRTEPVQTKPPAEKPSAPSESHDIQGDKWAIEMRGTRIKTLDAMIRHCKIDLTEWRVDRFQVNKWEVGRRDKKVSLRFHKGVASGTVRDTGKVFVEPLFQVKVWLVKKVDVVSLKNEIAALGRIARRIVTKPPKIVRKHFNNAEHMLELSIPDAHLGRLATKEETGWDDYDLDIARNVFEDAVASLVARTSAFRFEQVCLVIGNDMMNFDGLTGATTKGTPQSNAAKYHKVFETSREVLIRGVESLRVVAPVKVIVVPGNHDELSAWHLGDTLRSYFHSYKDVEVDNSPTSKKYYQFGRVMLMWTHGADGKRDKYPLDMATEQPDMWGRTQYREAHIGHLHHLETKEHNGVRVRILPSLAAVDDWSARNSHIGAIRGAEAYVWHKRDGLVTIAYYVVPDKYKVIG